MKLRHHLWAAALAATATVPMTAVAEPVGTPLPETPPTFSSPGDHIARTKLIFLFHHRPDWSREHFRLHYIENHAALGYKYNRNLLGYVVNIADSPHHVDALAELYVTTADDLLDFQKSATQEGREKIGGDRISDGKVATLEVEEKVVRGAPISSPQFRATPGVKLVWIYGKGETVSPAPSGGYRVVENRVIKQTGAMANTNADGFATPPAEIAFIREIWADKAEDVGKPESRKGAIIVTEYRFRPSPWK